MVYSMRDVNALIMAKNWDRFSAICYVILLADTEGNKVSENVMKAHANLVRSVKWV
jgi:hypothetical protein